MFAAKKTDQASTGVSIQYVGGTSGSFTPSAATSSITVSLTGLTGGIASAPSYGDLIVITTGLGGVNDYPLYNTGKTLARAYANDTQDNVFSVFAKYALVAEDLTSARFISSNTSSNRQYVVTVHVFRNATGYFVPASVIATATTLNTAVPNPPSITPTVAGSIIHVAASAGHQAGVQNFTASYLSGFISAPSSDLNYDTTTGAGYVTWTSGSYDPAAWTFGGTDSTTYSNNSATLAIAPNTTYTNPTYIAGTTEQQAASNATIVINKPANTVENDLMVAIVKRASNSGTWSGPSGWTEALDTGGIAVYYKTAGASEGSSYTFTPSASSANNGIIMTFRGAAWDTIGTTATGTSITIPAITLAANNSTVLAIAATGSNEDFLPEINDNTFTYVYKNIANQAIYSIITTMKQGVSSGSTGTVSAGTFSSSSSIGFLIGIKPSP